MADNTYVNPYQTDRGDDLLDQTEFPDNSEIRCPVVLCLDTSGSMIGPAIAEVNQGLRWLAEAWRQDRLAARRVEVALITFGGGVRVADLRSGSSDPIDADARQAFVAPDHLNVPTLSAYGDTPMGQAVSIAVKLLTERKAYYKAKAVDYFRPQMYLFTDGNPTDPNWEEGARTLRDEENRKGVSVWPFGVDGADFSKLARFANRSPVSIPNRAEEFQKLFVWLSKSVSAVSNSGSGARQVPAPELAPTWGQIDLGV